MGLERAPLVGGLGWGVLISTIADTQQVAFQMGLLSSMLPTLLLSGFVFPISSMPTALQVISHIVPARYFIAALREVKEKTVRQQATSIYAKAGYAGRHELVAHFIEDLMSEI